jgi:hypothetical protein
MGLFGILGRRNRSEERSPRRPDAQRDDRRAPIPMPPRPPLGEGWHVVDLQGFLRDPDAEFEARGGAGLSAGNPPGATAEEVPPFDPGWWEPIVIDQAIFPFQPRPNRPGIFRADTVCDGWSSRHFTVRAASVRGYEHRYRGIPRQDDVVIALHPRTETVVFAVADGLSAATRADLGAAIAGQAAVRAVLDALDQGTDPPPWRQVLRHAQWHLTDGAREELDAGDPTPDQVEALFATALTIGTVRPALDGPRVTLVRIGGSGAWLLHQGHFLAVPAGAPAPSLPRLPDTVEPAEFTLPPEAVLLIGTNGFARPLGDGSGPVGELFGGALPIPPSPIGLARMLDFSRERFDEDRSLVAIWPSSGR